MHGTMRGLNFCRRAKALLLLLGVPWLALASAAAGDWPSWRGSETAGQGGEEPFPHAWTSDDWVWSVELPGVGHASPVVWRGRVYTASASTGPDGEAGGIRFVSCHAATDGRLLWQQKMPGPIDHHHVQNSSASGSAAVNECGVYWMWATRESLQVEAFTHDGHRMWHADLGPFQAEHGCGASPSLWHDRVIVPIDQDGLSAVVALDARTGQERWRLPRETAQAAYSTPLVLDGDAPLVVLAGMAHGLTGIDPATGKVVWERKCFSRRTVSSPVKAGPLVLGTCGEGGGDNTLVALRLPTPAMLAASAGKLIEPDVVYQLDRSVAPYVPTPLCTGRRIYLWGDRGVVTCVAAADGQLLWRGRVGGMFSASPIAVGGTVVNVSADGEVVVIADADALNVLGRSSLGEESRSTPAVADGRLFFRSVGHLRAIGR